MVHVRDGQSNRPLGDPLLSELKRCGEAALEIIASRYHARVKLPGVVNVTLIDDAEIARVHAQFMDDPSPTDVITFPYGEEGEILISVETAERQSAEYQVSFEREVALYLVHGPLHLGGYDDQDDAAQR